MNNRKPKGLVGTSLTRQTPLNRDKFNRVKSKASGTCATCRKPYNAGQNIHYYSGLMLSTHAYCKNPMKGA